MSIAKNVFIFFILLGFFAPSSFQSATAVNGQYIQTVAIEKKEKSNKIQSKDLLENALKWSNSFNHYSCKFSKKERLEDGLSDEQIAQVKAKQSPSSVRMEWEGGKVKVSVWREGWDYVKLDPRYWFKISLKLNDKIILKESLNPISAFGFTKTLNRMKAILIDADSTLVEEVFNSDKKITGYILTVNHKYTENGKEFIAKTVARFDSGFNLQRAEQTDQDGVKFVYEWENINTQIELTDKDFAL